MPMFNYRCDKCGDIVEKFVKRYDVVVECEECGEKRVKLFSGYRYTFGVGHFFEPYIDTDIHPDGEPIPIRTQQEFFDKCREHGRGYRKVSDKMR